MLQDSKLDQQVQPTPMSCVCTCLAMLMDRPAEEVVAQYHHDYFNAQTIDVHDILRNEGFIFQRMQAGHCATMESGAVYMLTVASLNVQGGLHQIMVDYRNPAAPRVLDPACGYGKRKYYTADQDVADSIPNAFMLFSWIIDYKITDRG